jgi:hypothetical protein
MFQHDYAEKTSGLYFTVQLFYALKLWRAGLCCAPNIEVGVIHKPI